MGVVSWVAPLGSLGLAVVALWRIADPVWSVLALLGCVGLWVVFVVSECWEDL